MAFTGNGRFKVGRELGSGAFGAVFEAFDALQSRKVAIKLLTHLSGDSLLSFKREFRSLTGVRHPNLVSRYELLSDGKVWFFTMELVDGLELLEYLARNELARSLQGVTIGRDTAPVPATPPQEPANHPSLTRQYLRDLRVTLKQLVDGIHALHASGHLHRDIKPSNVLVTPEGRVVMVDFGLAVAIDDMRDAIAGGTPGYMSPEQAEGKPLTAATDWFSVGVLLYQALTGAMPWTTDTRGHAPWRDVKPVPPRELVPGAPSDLNDLCLDLLNPDPDLRPTGDDVRRRIGSDSLIYTVPAIRPGTLGQPGFVGREAERAELHAAFDATMNGELATIAVHGEPGIGKTTLVNRFFDELRVRQPDTVILAGRCSAREWVPFNAIDVVIESLASTLRRLDPETLEALLPPNVAEIARVFPVLETVPAIRRRVLVRGAHDADPAVAASALRDLLHGLCAERPVVIFIDDAQWGDYDTARLLESVLASPAPPLLLITAYTADDAPTSLLLNAIGGKLHQTVVALGPMPSHDAEALAHSVLTQWPRVQASPRPIVRESGGNPFLIDFLARHRKRQRTRALRLGDAIRSEVAQLDADARALLVAIAVAGAPLELSIAYDVAAVTHRAFESLSALRERRLARSRITGAIEEVEIYHRRIRDAILAEVDESEQKRIRTRIDEELTRRMTLPPVQPIVHLGVTPNARTERHAGYAKPPSRFA